MSPSKKGYGAASTIVFSPDMRFIVCVPDVKKKRENDEQGKSSKHVPYGLPGGNRNVEHDDDTADTAVRELIEETGITTSRESVIQTPYAIHFRDGLPHEFYVVFLEEKVPLRKESYYNEDGWEETGAPEWWRIDEALRAPKGSSGQLALHFSHRRALVTILQWLEGMTPRTGGNALDESIRALFVEFETQIRSTWNEMQQAQQR